MAWDDREHDQIVKLLAIVCEVTATEMSDGARRLILEKLKSYSAPSVLKALNQCSGQCKFKLTLAEIIERIEASRNRVPDAEATRRMLENRDQEFKEQKKLDADRIKQLVAHISEKM